MNTKFSRTHDVCQRVSSMCVRACVVKTLNETHVALRAYACTHYRSMPFGDDNRQTLASINYLHTHNKRM